MLNASHHQLQNKEAPPSKRKHAETIPPTKPVALLSSPTKLEIPTTSAKIQPKLKNAENIPIKDMAKKAEKVALSSEKLEL